MWGKLWLHESERVYADRLVSQQVNKCAAFVAKTGTKSITHTYRCSSDVLASLPQHCNVPRDPARALPDMLLLCADNPQDLETYKKAAVAVAKKYFTINDIDDFYKKKDARPLIFCHFARSLGDKTYDEVSLGAVVAIACHELSCSCQDTSVLAVLPPPSCMHVCVQRSNEGLLL